MTTLFNTKPLSDMSLEELKKQEQSFKIATRVATGVLVLLVVATLIRIYLKAHLRGDTFLLIGFIFLSMLTGDKLKKIKAEISARA